MGVVRLFFAWVVAAGHWRLANLSPRSIEFDDRVMLGFNAGYARILESWGLFVGGVNPVARTNIAPEVDPPTEPVLYGFSYSRPSDSSLPFTCSPSTLATMPITSAMNGALLMPTSK